MLDIFSGSFELEDYHGARLLRVALSDLSFAVGIRIGKVMADITIDDVTSYHWN